MMNDTEINLCLPISQPQVWLITGVAGFIGSNLLEHLLKLNQTVIGLDNFSTGFQRNIDAVRESVTEGQWRQFRFIAGDIRDPAVCQVACLGVNYVLHQAALGSVPRSIDDPSNTNQTNVHGFLNMLVASRDAGVRRFVYAASSSSYGDNLDLPKVETNIGKPLSPYAVTKLVNELYADVFAKCYGMDCVGLRYFNVFGRRQDPEGAYAAVIPKWTSALINGESISIYGDGETSRDFCYVDNVVQANLLAATSTHPNAGNQVYNVAVGERTTLNQLFREIRAQLVLRYPQLSDIQPTYCDFRPGDVRHSLADISKAQRLLRYAPTHNLREGLANAVEWYISH